MTDMSFISRVDCARAVGWQVRLEQGPRETWVYKFFSDSKHGGSRGAKRAAIKFRNTLKIQPKQEGVLVFRRGKAVWVES